MTDVKCTCGSGGHPRRCAQHPLNFELHVAELDLIGVCETKEQEDAVERLLLAARVVRDALRKELDEYKFMYEGLCK